MRSFGLMVICAVISSGCGNDWIIPKAPPTAKATPPSPQKATTDAGVTVPPDDNDAGQDSDAGTVDDTDAGTVIADAGTPDVDAGTLPDIDGGLPHQGPFCQPTTINATGTPPLGCYRIDGSAVGRLATYPVGNGTVTITGWTYKTDNATQTDGFSYTSTVVVEYAVKSGTDVDYGTESPWANPRGDSGPTVSGISNVTICECPTEVETF